MQAVEKQHYEMPDSLGFKQRVIIARVRYNGIPIHAEVAFGPEHACGKTFWKIETANAIFWMYLGGTA